MRYIEREDGMALIEAIFQVFMDMVTDSPSAFPHGAISDGLAKVKLDMGYLTEWGGDGVYYDDITGLAATWYRMRQHDIEPTITWHDFAAIVTAAYPRALLNTLKAGVGETFMQARQAVQKRKIKSFFLPCKKDRAMFYFLNKQWDVDLAKRFKAQHLYALDATGQDLKDRVNAIRLTEEIGNWIATRGDLDGADIKLDNPVIVADMIGADGEEDQGGMLIDGWHRVKKASRDGVEWLPAIGLTREESRDVAY